MASRLLFCQGMRWPFALGLVSSLSLSIGCVVEPEPVYVPATYVPADIETYPYVVYEGRPVYYVRDRWYVRSGPNWVYYREAPSALREQRPYVQQAPPAHRAPVQRAPPAYRAPTHEAPPSPEPREYTTPPPRSAPPAHQVR